ncbi:MAG: hypothetical protein IT479_11780 [Xanthomonadales bacterium]|nr:hypothetical protein [Xanthomonadales bacterium]MCC6593941.1 hypothetical protein [Xanthomonadales bacterium]MCE7930511.1 hypothetical protein [Xanthomonadales bacterium PRO6]
MRTFLPFALLALAACGSEPTPPPPPTKEPPRTSTVFDDTLKARDKAQAVEAQNLEHKKKLDEQLDGGG